MSGSFLFCLSLYSTCEAQIVILSDTVAETTMDVTTDFPADSILSLQGEGDSRATTP